MYECKNIGIVTVVGNILKCNDSPKKSDGRGVSAERFKERFKRYASNLVGLKRYLALVGIKGTTSRIAHNNLILTNLKSIVQTILIGVVYSISTLSSLVHIPVE